MGLIMMRNTITTAHNGKRSNEITCDVSWLGFILSNYGWNKLKKFLAIVLRE